jgi:hypothetical protein
LENFCPPRDDEGNGLNVRIIDRLKGSDNLIFMHVHPTLGHETNAPLGVAGFVLRKVLKFIILVLEIADVAVTGIRQLLDIIRT